MNYLNVLLDEISNPGLNLTPYILTLLVYYLDLYFSGILVRVHTQFYFVCMHYLYIKLTCTFSLLNNVLILLCIIFLTYL